jgi:hypothetical protein
MNFGEYLDMQCVMTWFKFIMVCMKFDYGMNDHCNIQHLTLISFTLNTCV